PFCLAVRSGRRFVGESPGGLCRRRARRVLRLSGRITNKFCLLGPVSRGAELVSVSQLVHERTVGGVGETRGHIPLSVIGVGCLGGRAVVRITETLRPISFQVIRVDRTTRDRSV